MLSVFTATLSPMLVIFLFLLVGFILNKTKIVPQNTDIILSKIETYVFIPALIINSFSANCTVNSLKTYYPQILYSLLLLFCALLIAYPLSKCFSRNDKYLRNVYKYSLVFANFGFFGNALIPMLFGADDPAILYKYLLFTMPMQIFVYTWGLAILIPDGKNRKSVLSRLNNPTVYSIAIGIIMGLCNLTRFLPSFITQTLSSLSSCMAPIAMIITGFVIGGYNITELLSNKKVYAVTILRLLILPSILLMVLYVTGASKFIMTLALFAYSAPLGMNTVLFPATFGGDTKTGASMTLISQILSILTIPLLYSTFSLIVR